MPINYDLLNQALNTQKLKDDAALAAAVRLAQEEDARRINDWHDYMEALGICAEYNDIDDEQRPYIHAGGYRFGRVLFRDYGDWAIAVMDIATGEEALPYPRIPFTQHPSKWDQEWRDSLMADIARSLESLKAQPAPAAQPDEQPLDLMPTTLIHDDCEAAYELLKSASFKLSDLISDLIMFPDLDRSLIYTRLEKVEAELDEFLGTADEPEPDDEPIDDGQDEHGDPRWLRHIESTEYIPEIDAEQDESLQTWAGDDTEQPYTEDDYPASEPPETEFIDPGYIGDGFTNEYDYDHPVHGNATDEAPAADEPAPADPFIELIRSGDFVILDTETTGLGDDAEICQIAVIDSSGNVLLDTLVKPTKPIPAQATAIHHITNDMVKDATNWLNLNEKVWELLRGKEVIVYNAEFDFRLLAQSEQACEPLALSDWHTIKRHCAMLRFAEIYHEWDSYRRSWKWQKLETAARYYALSAQNAHTALGDCLTTLAVCKAMAKAE